MQNCILRDAYKHNVVQKLVFFLFTPICLPIFFRLVGPSLKTTAVRGGSRCQTEYGWPLKRTLSTRQRPCNSLARSGTLACNQLCNRNNPFKSITAQAPSCTVIKCTKIVVKLQVSSKDCILEVMILRCLWFLNDKETKHLRSK